MQSELKMRHEPQRPPRETGDQSLPGWPGATALAPDHGALLVCVGDHDSAERVIAHADAIGGALGVPLALAHVVEPDGHAGQPQDPLEWSLRRHRGRDRLAQLAAQRRSPGEDMPSILLEGAAAEQLSRWMLTNSARVLAFATRGDVERRGLGGTASRLVEMVPASLLLVPPAAPTEAAYRRILVPLDGSYRAEGVLQLALPIARASGAEILLAHVVPEVELTAIGPLEAEAIELREKVVRRNHRVAREYLERVLRRVEASGIRARIAIARGDARGALGRMIADEGADLVVLSAQGQGGGAEAPCGKVSAFLAAHAATPMLIVRDAQTARPSVQLSPPPPPLQ